MARVALVTGGSRGIGAAISVALKNAGYKVAANYAGNDEAAQKFKAETGIPVYKWSVADYDACAAGIKQVEADLGPVDVLVNNAGITRDAHVPQDDAAAMERGHRHQSLRRLQHDASGVERHARPQVRPRHHHLLDQRPEGPGRPGQLFGGQGRRHRLHQGAGAGRRARRHHRQRHLPRLHRHRDGHGGAGEGAERAHHRRRSRSAASASRRRSRAASSSSPPTRPASSPARRSRPMAGSILTLT